MYDILLENENIANSAFARSVRVAVLAGGKSSEREISLASGKATEEALREAGFQTQLIDPSNRDDLKMLLEEPFDVAFLCLHGKLGEDGAIQGFFETVGMPYTGSDIMSSVLAFDKTKAKLIYREANIPIPLSIELSKAQLAADEAAYKEIAQRAQSELSPVCVVKPVSEGSSYGVYIADTEEAIIKALKDAFELADRVLIEQFISGTEYTVAVVGGKKAQALPVIEIVPKNEFYDFASKYEPGGSKHLCPAPLSEEQTKRVQELAVRAHQALGCKGASRSDFILDDKGTFWILETNTIPGMTKTSLLPDAARAVGIEFPELCARLVKLTLEEGKER